MESPDKVSQAADTFTQWFTYLWVVGLAMWGGAVSYFQKITRYNLKFNLLRFLAEIATSGFAGILTFLLCDSAGFSWEVTAAFVGISGHMGTRALFMIEKRYDKIIGGSDESK